MNNIDKKFFVCMKSYNLSSHKHSFSIKTFQANFKKI